MENKLNPGSVFNDKIKKKKDENHVNRSWFLWLLLVSEKGRRKTGSINEKTPFSDARTNKTFRYIVHEVL